MLANEDGCCFSFNHIFGGMGSLGQNKKMLVLRYNRKQLNQKEYDPCRNQSIKFFQASDRRKISFQTDDDQMAGGPKFLSIFIIQYLIQLFYDEGQKDLYFKVQTSQPSQLAKEQKTVHKSKTLKFNFLWSNILNFG